jgi:hypothetical protein
MEGYAKLGTLMGAFPEVAIIRRFAALNAQNILYLQAELIDLESRLRKCEKDDDASDDLTRAAYALNWYKLKNSARSRSHDNLDEIADGERTSQGDAATEKSIATKESADPIDNGERWRTTLQVREKLKEYSMAPPTSPFLCLPFCVLHRLTLAAIDEAVLQQAELAKLQKPNPRDLRFLKEWLDRPDMGGVYLTGQDSDVWEDPDRFDLIAVKARRTESILSSWMSDRIVNWYHSHIGRHLQVGYNCE